jgi:phospholipase C
MAKDLSKVQQVVIVMMENRSFDHVLGYLSLPEFGHPLFHDIDGIAQARTFYSGQQFGPRTLQSPSLSPDPPHERTDIAVQLARNAAGSYGMDGFVTSYLEWLINHGFVGANLSWLAGNNASQTVRPDGVMEYCAASQVPTTDFLARNFTICDRSFASLPASTLPNRLFAMSGHALKDVTPEGYLADAKNFLFLRPDDLLYHWLDKWNIAWRVYHQGSPFFAGCQSMADKIHNPNLFKDLSQLADDAANDALLGGVTFIEPLYQDDPFLSNRQATDNHPPASIWGGEAFLKKVYDAISRSPSWGSTVMIVTYDEHGAFFDHAEPLPIQTPTPAGQTYTPFDSSGVRVPTIVVSPFVSAGGVSHAVMDHTSTLMFLAELYGHVPYNTDVAARGGVVSLSEVLDDALLAPGAAARPAPSMSQAPPIPAV